MYEKILNYLNDKKVSIASMVASGSVLSIVLLLYGTAKNGNFEEMISELIGQISMFYLLQWIAIFGMIAVVVAVVMGLYSKRTYEKNALIFGGVNLFALAYYWLNTKSIIDMLNDGAKAFNGDDWGLWMDFATKNAEYFQKIYENPDIIKNTLLISSVLAVAGLVVSFFVFKGKMPVFFEGDIKLDNANLNTDTIINFANNSKETVMNTAQSLTPEQKKKGLIAVVGIFVLALLFKGGSAVVDFLSRPTIDIMENAEITVNENDWNGQGEISFDYDIDFDETNEELADFIYDIDFEYPENNGKLSNGDKITVKATYSEETAKKIGVKVKNTEMTFEVSGLKEMPANEKEINTKMVELLDTDAIDFLKETYKEDDYYSGHKFTKLYNFYLIDSADTFNSDFDNKLGVVYKIEYKYSSWYSEEAENKVEYRAYYVNDIEKGQEKYPVEVVYSNYSSYEDNYSTAEVFKTSSTYKKFFNGRTEGYSGYVFNLAQ